MTTTLLVLDLDDTLYPERQFVESGFAAVDRWLRREHGVVGFGEHARAIFDAGGRGTVFDVALHQLGLPVTLELIATLVSVYRSHEPEITLHGDAAWCLQAMAGTCELGLLTDGYLATQQAKVRALGIASRFRAIVYSDEFGRACWKPSPRPYEAMMERAGRAGSDCIYVSDNPGKDFITANALGWTTIRIRRPDGIYAHLDPAPQHAPLQEIASLYDLPAAIAKCRGGSGAGSTMTTQLTRGAK